MKLDDKILEHEKFEHKTVGDLIACLIPQFINLPEMLLVADIAKAAGCDEVEAKVLLDKFLKSGRKWIKPIDEIPEYLKNDTEGKTLNSEGTLEDAMTELRQVKDQKKEVSDQLKDLNAQDDYLQGLIIKSLQAQGLEKASCAAGSASIKTDTYPQIKDMPLFMKWIVNHGQFHCLRADSLKAAPYRELVLEGEEIPGVDEFEKTKLSFRRK